MGTSCCSVTAAPNLVGCDCQSYPASLSRLASMRVSSLVLVRANSPSRASGLAVSIPAVQQVAFAPISG